MTNEQRAAIIFETLREDGRSQRWLAGKIGKHESLISRFKHGVEPVPDWFIHDAAEALGIRRSLLFFSPSQLPDGKSQPEAA